MEVTEKDGVITKETELYKKDGDKYVLVETRKEKFDLQQLNREKEMLEHEIVSAEKNIAEIDKKIEQVNTLSK